MPLDPSISAAEQAAAEILGSAAADTPAVWRALALRVDKEVIAPHVADAPVVETHDVLVEVPGRASVPVRVFVPPTRPRGIYLFFFGGAFRQGGVDFPSVDAMLRARAVDAETVIVAPSYALAPEDPYPAAVQQALPLLEWTVGQTARYGLAASAVTVGGMSAGANIAAVTAILARDNDIPIRQQLLEVPVTDLTGAALDAAAGELLGIPEDVVRSMLAPIAELYLDGADPRLPTVSPLFTSDLSRLAPATVLTAEYDPLRGDGAAYAAALREQGTSANEYRFDGITHGGLAFTRTAPAAQEWHRTVVRTLAA